jgi:hypothetical protein
MLASVVVSELDLAPRQRFSRMAKITEALATSTATVE